MTRTPPDPNGCAPGALNELDLAIPADPQLVADGWERRYLADPERAQEAIELYTSLGFEVKAQKLTPANFGPLCGECPAHVCLSYVMIYTRRRDAREKPDSTP